MQTSRRQETSPAIESLPVPASYLAVRTDLVAIRDAVAGVNTLLGVDDLNMVSTLVCPSQLGAILRIVLIS